MPGTMPSRTESITTWAGRRFGRAPDAVRGVFDPRGIVHPLRFGGQAGNDALGQRDGRTARRILLLGVVYLRDAYAVAAHAADHLRQIAVEAEHQVYAQAVVRGVEQRPALLAAQLLEFRQTIRPAVVPLTTGVAFSMQVRILP